MRIRRFSLSQFPIAKLACYVVTFCVGVLLAVGVMNLLPSAGMAAVDSSKAVLSRTTGETPKQAAIPVPTDSENGNFVTAAVERVGSAVVRIDTARTITRNIEPFDDPFFRRFFGEDFFGQMPRERKVRGQGSGLIVDSNGIVVTNAHVVKNADRVTVTLKDGRSFDGEVRGSDEVTDLAVVKISGRSLPVAELGDSDKLRVGDWAIALGNPLGLDSTVTLGIISTLNRSSSQAGIPDKRLDFIQTDAAINPGNSGGPLLNERGEVIGINTAIRADANGIGFAIPVNKVKEVKGPLSRGEAVQHPFVGIQMVTLTPEMVQENNSDPNTLMQLPDRKGVLVVRVMSNTPAERAGIRRGDVIFEVEGKSVTSASQLQDVVEASQVGDVLTFKIQRSDRTLTLDVRTAQLRNAS